jgi:alanyl-tRNA synthetase
MTSVSDIRATYLAFFERNGHKVLPSSPLVPHNDPTLMFTNAGMNQFKNVFTGAEKPVSPRATTAQKCVRAGGKHNDLDNVGYTRRHHTFFEMMGNFSFGDYFKEGAITHAWELLTKDFGLNKDRLYFTVYHTDDEAFNLWKKITGCSDDRILRIPTNDNFWSMGDTGPCGPSSEIFYDHGDTLNGQWALKPDGYDLFDERYVEIWNLVFMQYDQIGPDKRIDLPKPCIDTGMGLERMAAVLQGVSDNYDIDLFRHLIDSILEHSKNKGGAVTPSHKVIADHLRASSFLIADGVLPSNEGRGYVLRRIMRRAMRHAHLLGCTEPLMYKLVPALVNEMGAHYQELRRSQPIIMETLKLEEERFQQTLDRGLKLLEDEIANVKTRIFPGDVAFKLYDTYGFPLDLTQDILRGKDMSVDQTAFDASMAEQKKRARAAWAGSGDAGTQAVWFDLKEKVGITEFLGYQATRAEGVITAIVVDGQSVASIAMGQKGYIIANQTPFYAESGGQVGDTGIIGLGDSIAKVFDTKKPLEDFFIHEVGMEKGSLKVGDAVSLFVDGPRRDAIRANHSATHLLHAVLRRQLGEHITQKGSLVAADRLRFDISHPKAITPEEIARIETEVNRLVWENSEVGTRLMPPEEAIKAGAMALFGEKYGDEVRVLNMGLHEEAHYSVELCGGTHVSRTGDIGLFKIVSEGAVAAGVRRIEAVTRQGAFDYLRGQDDALRSLAQELKTKPEDISEKVARLAEEKKKLEKQLADAKKQLAMGGGGSAGASGEMTPEMIGEIPFIGKAFDDLPPKDLRDLITNVSKQHKNAVVAMASAFEGKASVIISIGDEVTAAVDAPTMVRAAVETLGGQGGGGKPKFAQGGGPDVARIGDAIQRVKDALGA